MGLFVCKGLKYIRNHCQMIHVCLYGFEYMQNLKYPYLSIIITKKEILMSLHKHTGICRDKST